MSDKIFDISAFEKFLHDRIKVEGRVGNLGDKVVISQSGEGKVEVVAHIPFSGRYLKYLYVTTTPASSGGVSTANQSIAQDTNYKQDQEVPQEAAAP